MAATPLAARVAGALSRNPSLAAVLAAGLGLLVLSLVATWAAGAVERRTEAAVRSTLVTEMMTWAEVETDGLQVRLSGTAPDEAARFRAVNLAGRVVDPGRVRDRIEVAPVAAIAPPRFSVEILRNTDGVSLIGLVPAAGDSAGRLAAAVAALPGAPPVADMLETADYPAPDGWQAALDFGIAALAVLPRAKVSVAADRVAVTAISDSEAERRRIEAELAGRTPPGLAVDLDISAPRPVLTPFTLRLVKDAGGVRFDACSADTERARDRILAAARAAGADPAAGCTVGLGVPTPRWAEAVEAAVAAVAALPEATVTFSDADVALLAGSAADQALFDRVVGDLRAGLPPVFSLTATRAPRDGPATPGPVEFTAVLAADGRLEMRGRVTDELMRAAVESFARARFGAEAVYNATRVDGDLPPGWPVRVFAGLESLAQLAEGRVAVRPDSVEVSGVTGRSDARARVAQVLSARLGAGQTFRVDIRYDEALDPLAALPTPEECAASLNAVVAAKKITFTPGSAEIDSAALGVVDALATILEDCPGLAIEIAGHTDSQGSEGGNLALSQARAEAVLVALQGRGLPVGAFVARGYGETRPIADNADEAGREANRRIEFVLLAQPRPGGARAEPQAPREPAAAAAPGPAAGTRPAPRPGAAAAPDTAGAAAPAAAAGPGRAESAPAAPPAAPAAAPPADAAPGVDGDDPPLQLAGAAVDPVNGATRAIVLTEVDAAAPVFVPTAERFPRPPRRP